jgi:cytidylate kinase
MCAVVTKLIVTMDGPSGTGKSSVSRYVAELSGLPHLDTGAFYRAATLTAIRRRVNLADEEAVVAAVEDVHFDQSDGLMTIDGEDVSDSIRSEAVTSGVSEVSAYPGVRNILVKLQRHWVERHQNRAVVEGRDIGSVVFPDANVKIYLDARPEVRAERRAKQSGEDAGFVATDIARRDHLDSTRKTSPLTVPEGAIRVDTSDLSLDEVVDHIVELINAKS